MLSSSFMSIWLKKKLTICLPLVTFSAVPVNLPYLTGNDFLLPFKENSVLITIIHIIVNWVQYVKLHVNILRTSFHRLKSINTCKSFNAGGGFQNHFLSLICSSWVSFGKRLKIRDSVCAWTNACFISSSVESLTRFPHRNDEKSPLCKRWFKTYLERNGAH